VMAGLAALSLPSYWRMHPAAGAVVSGNLIRQEREATATEG